MQCSHVCVYVEYLVSDLLAGGLHVVGDAVLGQDAGGRVEHGACSKTHAHTHTHKHAQSTRSHKAQESDKLISISHT